MTLTAFGQTRSVEAWAKDLGVPALAIWARVRIYRWPAERAVSRPPAHPRGFMRRTWVRLARMQKLEQAKKELADG